MSDSFSCAETKVVNIGGGKSAGPRSVLEEVDEALDRLRIDRLPGFESTHSWRW